MTGFARQEAQHPWGSLSCEIRSVNHRYLEPTIRLADALKSQEPELREALRKGLSRGKVEAGMHLKTDVAENTTLALNHRLAEQLSALAEQLATGIKNPAPLNPVDILRWPGVLQAAEIDPAALSEAAVTLFKTTLDHLIDNREREGQELAVFIQQRLTKISELVATVRTKMPALQAAFQEKLRTRLDALDVEVDEERFQQEVVYLCQKSDVAEELDRLEAHVQEVSHTLSQSGPIGRRLDFLMQELNREANTLSSKSLSSDTSQIAVDLKVLIEQMREQVQNIE